MGSQNCPLGWKCQIRLLFNQNKSKIFIGIDTRYTFGNSKFTSIVINWLSSFKCDSVCHQFYTKNYTHTQYNSIFTEQLS